MRSPPGRPSVPTHLQYHGGCHRSGVDLSSHRDNAASSVIGEEVQRFLTAFYADDGLIQARESVLLQFSFNILISLFDQVGFQTNTTKTKGIVYVLGKTHIPLTTEVYKNCREYLTSRAIGSVYKFSVRPAESTYRHSLSIAYGVQARRLQVVSVKLGTSSGCTAHHISCLPIAASEQAVLPSTRMHWESSK